MIRYLKNATFVIYIPISNFKLRTYNALRRVSQAWGLSAQSPPKMSMATTGDDASMRDNDDMYEGLFAKRRCCFRMPCLGSDSSSPTSSSYGSGWWERMRSPDKKEHFWTRGWMKVREWSEILAGPRWKTFIRRFHRNRHHGYTKQGSFQYDPMSYALNFDEGKGQNGNFDEDYMFRDFSTRYVAIPASAKSSMDLGKDGPTFT